MVKDPLLITGCARSGTSLIAGIIYRHGFQGGKLCGATKANPHGQGENAPLRNNTIKPYLKSNGLDPMGQNPLPKDLDKMKPFPDFRDKVHNILKDQGVDLNKPWFWKGAKLCLIWPEAVSSFPDASWIIARREDEKIIDSCTNNQKAPFMRKNKNRNQWQEWIDIHKERFEEMKVSISDIKEIWTSDIIEGKSEAVQDLREVIESFGMEWNPEIIKKFIDKKIWSGG